MEISVSTGLYYKKTYKDILQIISEAGGKQIELFLNDAFYNIDVDDILREVSKRGLRVSSIHTPLPSIADRSGIAEAEWMQNAENIARDTEASVVVSHILSSKRGNEIYSLDEEHKKNVIHFNRKESGIYFTTENHSTLRYPSFTQDQKKLYEFLSENDLYLTFDTTHYAPIGDIIQGFLKFEKFVKNIHLSDYQNKRDHLPILDGKLPIESFIEVLKDRKYTGKLTLEYDFDTPERCLYRSLEEQIDILHKNITWLESKLN